MVNTLGLSRGDIIRAIEAETGAHFEPVRAYKPICPPPRELCGDGQGADAAGGPGRSGWLRRVRHRHGLRPGHRTAVCPGTSGISGEGMSGMTNEYCARCGKRLADNPGGLRKYCPDCAKARRRQSWREYQRRRRSGDPVPKAVCERCGVEYKKPAIVRCTARIAGTLW